MSTSTATSENWTIAEVAAFFRVTTWTIRRWMQAGSFPKPNRTGGRYLWPSAVVREVFERDMAGANHE